MINRGYEKLTHTPLQAPTNPKTFFIIRSSCTLLLTVLALSSSP